MATIEPGQYTIQQLIERAGFDLGKAGADYLEGKPDHRRVTVGGLPFTDLTDEIVVPYNATEVEVTLDGKTEAILEVDNGVRAEE